LIQQSQAKRLGKPYYLDTDIVNMAQAHLAIWWDEWITLPYQKSVFVKIKIKIGFWKKIVA
jgi:hypothetical protein